MPQASDKLRDKMGERFGSRTSEFGPNEYLKKRGWKEKRGLWRCPYDEPSDIPDPEDECITFLIFEYDHDITFDKVGE